MRLRSPSSATALTFAVALLMPFGWCGCEQHSASSVAPVALQEVRFQVDGMHCGNCAEAIRDELAQDASRRDIAVSHETRIALFLVPAPSSAEARTAAGAAIRALGYTVTDLEPGQPAGPVVAGD